MNLQNWYDEMSSLTDQIKAKERAKGLSGERISSNEVLPVEDVALFAQVEERYGTKIPEQIAHFWRHCGGLDLTEVYNSYFIWSLSMMMRTQMEYVPLYIDSKAGKRILTFGSDIGGELFAVDMEDGGKILFLQTNGVADNVYHSYEGSVHVIAPDFYTFLERIVEDTKAELRGDPNWKFMTQVR